MKCPDFIKNILPKAKRHKGKDIALLGDLITLPSHEELSRDPEKIQELNSYKKEYWTKLLDKSSVVSTNLELDQLRSKMKMYVDLLGNIINDNDEYRDSFEKIMYYEDGTKRINQKIKLAKLKLYQKDIARLEQEAILRIVALKELLEEKKFLSLKKKRSIKEEITNLCYTALIFINSKRAIFLELSSYLAEYTILDSEEFVDEDIENAIFLAKKDELLEMFKTFNIELPNKVYTLDSLELAEYEKILEESIYSNDFVDRLFRQLDILYKSVMRKFDHSPEIVNEIAKKEYGLKALCMFGKELITKENIDLFYTMKFWANEEKLLEDPKSFLKDANHFEVNCYQSIIAQKLSDFLKGDSALFNEGIEESQFVLNAVKRILKGDNDEYSYWDILFDKIKLGVLFNVHSKESLRKFFKETMIPIAFLQNLDKRRYANLLYSPSMQAIVNESTDDTSIPYTSPITSLYRVNGLVSQFITYGEEISLENLCIIISCNIDTKSETELKDNPLYELYIISRSPETSEFRLPEGIKSISYFTSTWHTSEHHFMRQLVEKMKDKTLITPSTLEKLNGEVFRKTTLENVIFNDGLKELEGRIFYESTIKGKVQLPPSLNSISKHTFVRCNLNEVELRNYEESALFLEENQEQLVNLISSLYELKTSGQEITLISGNHKIVSRYRLIPKFSSLIFSSKDECIKVSSEELGSFEGIVDSTKKWCDNKVELEGKLCAHYKEILKVILAKVDDKVISERRGIK